MYDQDIVTIVNFVPVFRARWYSVGLHVRTDSLRYRLAPAHSPWFSHQRVCTPMFLNALFRGPCVHSIAALLSVCCLPYRPLRSCVAACSLSAQHYQRATAQHSPAEYSILALLLALQQHWGRRSRRIQSPTINQGYVLSRIAVSLTNHEGEWTLLKEQR